MQCSEKGAHFNGHWTIESLKMFEDVWKSQNLDLLALQETVSIKNHKPCGLRLKMVFLIISIPMIFTSITKLDLGHMLSWRVLDL